MQPFNMDAAEATHIPVKPVAIAKATTVQAIYNQLNRNRMSSLKHVLYGILIPISELDPDIRSEAIRIYQKMLDNPEA